MARYALADHVFLCVSGEHLVLLDLKEDRYWALEASQTAGLASLVTGWPIEVDGAAESVESPSSETAGALEVLQGRGLLADAFDSARSASGLERLGSTWSAPENWSKPLLDIEFFYFRPRTSVCTTRWR
jgi:hypothetical protein